MGKESTHDRDRELGKKKKKKKSIPKEQYRSASGEQRAVVEGGPTLCGSPRRSTSGRMVPKRAARPLASRTQAARRRSSGYENYQLVKSGRSF